MTVAGDSWGESYISYTECKGKIRIFLHILCKVYISFVMGRIIGGALDGD